MSELTLDQIEQRLRELPASEREAWLDYLNKRSAELRADGISSIEIIEPPGWNPIYPYPVYYGTDGTS